MIRLFFLVLLWLPIAICADDQPWKVVASDDVDDQTGWGHGRATHGSGPDVPDSPR